MCSSENLLCHCAVIAVQSGGKLQLKLIDIPRQAWQNYANDDTRCQSQCLAQQFSINQCVEGNTADHRIIIVNNWCSHSSVTFECVQGIYSSYSLLLFLFTCFLLFSFHPL